MLLLLLPNPLKVPRIPSPTDRRRSLYFAPLLSYPLRRRIVPFDQLLIELHGVTESHLKQLVACLESHGLFPFAREENLHGMACGAKDTHGIFEIEMSFLRGHSRFTVPALAAPGALELAPSTSSSSSSSSSSSPLSSLSILTSYFTSSTSSSSSSSSSTSSSSAATTSYDSPSRDVSSSMPSRPFVALPPRRRHAIRLRESLAMRTSYINNGKSHSGGYGKGWARHEAFRCSKGPGKEGIRK
jgi:hypothetical protein